MDGWMDGWVAGWVGGWVGGWMDGMYPEPLAVDGGCLKLRAAPRSDCRMEEATLCSIAFWCRLTTLVLTARQVQSAFQKKPTC